MEQQAQKSYLPHEGISASEIFVNLSSSLNDQRARSSADASSITTRENTKSTSILLSFGNLSYISIPLSDPFRSFRHCSPRPSPPHTTRNPNESTHDQRHCNQTPNHHSDDLFGVELGATVDDECVRRGVGDCVRIGMAGCVDFEGVHDEGVVSVTVSMAI